MKYLLLILTPFLIDECFCQETRANYCEYVVELIAKDFSDRSEKYPIVYVVLLKDKPLMRTSQFWVFESSNYPAKQKIPAFSFRRENQTILFYDYRFESLKVDSTDFPEQESTIFSQDSRSFFLTLKHYKEGFSHTIEKPNSKLLIKADRLIARKY